MQLRVPIRIISQYLEWLNSLKPSRRGKGITSHTAQTCPGLVAAGETEEEPAELMKESMDKFQILYRIIQ